MQQFLAESMSKVATAAQLPMSNTLHYGGVPAGGVSKTSKTALKRKTPSELRVTFRSLHMKYWVFIIFIFLI